MQCGLCDENFSLIGLQQTHAHTHTKWPRNSRLLYTIGAACFTVVASSYVRLAITDGRVFPKKPLALEWFQKELAKAWVVSLFWLGVSRGRLPSLCCLSAGSHYVSQGWKIEWGASFWPPKRWCQKGSWPHEPKSYGMRGCSKGTNCPRLDGQDGKI